MPAPPPPPSNPSSADVLVGVHAERLAEHTTKIEALDKRVDTLDLQVAVWKGQLRMLAAIAGLVGGGVGGLVAAAAGSLAG